MNNRCVFRAAGIGFTAIVAAALLLVIYVRLFTFWPINSDQANVMLAAMDMDSGNWRLHGWTLPPDSFWGLDIPTLGVIWSFTHNAVFTERFVPALEWLILGGVILGLASSGRKSNWTSCLFFLLAIFFLPTLAKGTILFISDAPTHTLTAACILGAIWLAHSMLKAPPGARSTQAILYGLVTVDAAASDPMFVMLGVLPILAALAFADFPVGAPRIRLAVYTVALTAAGRLLITLNTATGGFHPSATDFMFVDFFDIPRSVGILLKSILDILNCDPFGFSVHQRLTQLLRLPLLLLVCIVFYRTAKRLFISVKTPSPQNRAPAFIETALCLVIAADIASMLVSATVVDINNVRFLLPAWAAIAVLVARTANFNAGTQLYCAVLAVIALGADLDSLHAIRHKAPPAFAAIDENLAACLETLHLPQGYGTYWRASSVTLAAQRKVSVRALNIDGAGNVVPMLWVSTTAWYHPLPAGSSFFVITEANDASLPRENVLAAFGPPQSSINIDDATINVYGRKLAPDACQADGSGRAA
jgi:hypothetical protein